MAIKQGILYFSIIAASIVIGIVFLFLALYSIIKYLIRKPVELALKEMHKQGKISKELYEDYKNYIWWNHRAH